mmetsp:Transcript_13397/g.39184  ORF Transcript_13397/g.39184 Transcript_13397/m.39184 type:complete len:157 (-) Transcript_13397:777-1247(-)
MAQVRRCRRSQTESSKQKQDIAYPTLAYLNREEMSATLRHAVVSTCCDLSESSAPMPALGNIYGEKPTFEENDAERIQRALREIISMERCIGSTLLVTHGDVLGQWVGMVTGETVLECDYCGWTVFSDETPNKTKVAPGNFTKIEDHGIASLILEI